MLHLFLLHLLMINFHPYGLVHLINHMQLCCLSSRLRVSNQSHAALLSVVQIQYIQPITRCLFVCCINIVHPTNHMQPCCLSYIYKKSNQSHATLLSVSQTQYIQPCTDGLFVCCLETVHSTNHRSPCCLSYRHSISNQTQLALLFCYKEVLHPQTALLSFVQMYYIQPIIVGFVVFLYGCKPQTALLSVVQIQYLQPITGDLVVCRIDIVHSTNHRRPCCLLSRQSTSNQSQLALLFCCTKVLHPQTALLPVVQTQYIQPITCGHDFCGIHIVNPTNHSQPCCLSHRYSKFTQSQTALLSVFQTQQIQPITYGLVACLLEIAHPTNHRRPCCLYSRRSTYNQSQGVLLSVFQMQHIQSITGGLVVCIPDIVHPTNHRRPCCSVLHPGSHSWRSSVFQTCFLGEEWTYIVWKLFIYITKQLHCCVLLYVYDYASFVHLWYICIMLLHTFNRTYCKLKFSHCFFIRIQCVAIH